MLGVDDGGDTTLLLRIGDRVQRQRGLARRLGPIDLDDPATGKASDTQRDIECDRSGGDDLDGHPALGTETHHGTLAELTLDLGQGGLERLLAIGTAGASWGLAVGGGHADLPSCDGDDDE
ncbi:unannotated protein [freshwater metagenome]|uniref:Unannotated protein n=1 Tax=freshwater metagenome TaxID=449393 RepID=A0A6J7BQD4_9ZZZZ